MRKQKQKRKRKSCLITISISQKQKQKQSGRLKWREREWMTKLWFKTRIRTEKGRFKMLRLLFNVTFTFKVINCKIFEKWYFYCQSIVGFEKCILCFWQENQSQKHHFLNRKSNPSLKNWVSQTDRTDLNWKSLFNIIIEFLHALTLK